MEFARYDDALTVNKRLLNRPIKCDDFYPQAIYLAGKKHQRWDFQLDLIVEWMWWKHRRPYYNLWPAITESLMGFSASNVPFRSFLDASEPVVAIQFPKGGINGLRSILVAAFTKESLEEIWKSQYRLLNGIEASRPDEFHHNMLAITEEFDDWNGSEYRTQTRVFAAPSDDLDKTASTSSLELSEMQNLGIAVLLMEMDADLIEPDVLSSDRAAYAIATDQDKQRLEEKAFKRRNQKGWHVGRQVEVMPHYRRPHPALMWTGKGRSTAKVVMRSGCTVKRKVMTQVPTGYHGVVPMNQN